MTDAAAMQPTYAPAWVRGSLIPGMFGITQEADRLREGDGE